MKKFVSILLALTMALAMSVTAFAVGETTVTTARTYNGYKLLNLTTSLKCTTTDHTHADTCYDYIYSVNEKYKDILQTAAGETDILTFLSNQTSDSETGYGSLREVADSIYRAILTDKLDPDAEKLTGTNGIAQGYWLFADVTDLTGKENEANSLVMVDTKGQSDLTLTPKTGLPTIEKKVKDINDSTDTKIDDNAWQDSADHDIGDTVPFQITVTMPENLAGYDTYEVVIHDIMSAGLTLDASSIRIYVGTTDVTESFDCPSDDMTGEFAISCGNILGIENLDVTNDTVFVVYYEATLNESAEIGATGNPNEVYLEFSNDPYGDGTGKTETDKVIVFTYQVTINKVNPSNQPLEGAGFILYKKDASTGEYAAVGDELKGNNMTTFVWKGLDDGDYKLVENTVPAGYNKMEDKFFTISANHDEESTDPKLTSLNTTLGAAKLNDSSAYTGVIEDDIENNTGTVLPETGAKGTFMLIACSSMFVMVAAVFMVTRKKMSIYED